MGREGENDERGGLLSTNPRQDSDSDPGTARRAGASLRVGPRDEQEPPPPPSSSLLRGGSNHHTSPPEQPASKPKEAGKVGWLDLPNKDQLFVLAVCRLSEPLSNVCLLPYIFYLVRSVLAPEQEDGSDTDTAAQVSAYSGLLVACFPLAQFLVSLPWGRLSDSHGRKFSIVIGLAISVVANAAFGFSRSFGALLFWRTLAGLANGNVGIMRTMTAEVVKERRFQTKAFLLLPLVFNTGMVFSLAFGGMLAEPLANLPWLFGPSGVLNWSGSRTGVQWAKDYPYALPAMMNASMLGFAFLLAAFWLRETLPSKENERDIGVSIGRAVVRWVKRTIFFRKGQSYMPISDTEDFLFDPLQSHRRSRSLVELEEVKEVKEVTISEVQPIPTPARPRPPFKSVFTRRTIAALISFGLLPLHNSAFMHIFPVYLSTPHDETNNARHTLLAFTGGLGLRSVTIGIWLGVFGICGILLQLFIYPRMQARLGTLGVFKISLVMFPLVYLLAPYLSLLPDSGPLAFMRWFGLGVIVWGQIMARTMAIPSTVILLTEAAPTKGVLGTVHGAGNMLASLARAVGPAVGGAIYAAGVREGVIGAVWWFYLVVVAIVAAGWCFGVQGRAEPEEE
ncbi:major facilitator superfamily domain-containing protein [Diplogelasinospora grovesii]|uniref:Major facilitator superfamily domain-containing protein n=1 Tax=Diplogelasinospora grovesii TaxID=303347 RepID=A0AAN6N1N3_9PEZI|nr:major facilitator superfamily domain-containing protein [Diplogelasinospora grovesii]